TRERRIGRSESPPAPHGSIMTFLTHEVVPLVREQHVEGRERSITAGHVLLHLDLLLGRQLPVAVDLLLEDAEAIPNHDDLREERLDRDPLLLRPFLAGLENHLTALPATAELHVCDAELVTDDLAQDLAELVSVHVQK